MSTMTTGILAAISNIHVLDGQCSSTTGNSAVYLMILSHCWPPHNRVFWVLSVDQRIYMSSAEHARGTGKGREGKGAIRWLSYQSLCFTHTTWSHLQLGSRRENFTDVPKVVICSSDINGETLEAVWIVASLATTAAITVIVGWVRS